MNDTLGPEGLVPSALFFGEFPPVYIQRLKHPAPAQRLSNVQNCRYCTRRNGLTNGPAPS